MERHCLTSCNAWTRTGVLLVAGQVEVPYRVDGPAADGEQADDGRG